MRQQEIVDFIATDIVKSNFFKDNDAKAQFMRKHFVKAWERAIKQQQYLYNKFNMKLNFDAIKIPYYSIEYAVFYCICT